MAAADGRHRRPQQTTNRGTARHDRRDHHGTTSSKTDWSPGEHRTGSHRCSSSTAGSTRTAAKTADAQAVSGTHSQVFWQCLSCSRSDSAVFCTSCFHALDGKIVVPDAYRLQFDVTTKQASNRTANAIPVIIESGQPPSLGSTPMRSRDVAKLHDVPTTCRVQSCGRRPHPSDKRDSSNRFVFSEDLVDNEAVRDVLQSHTRAGPTANDVRLERSSNTARCSPVVSPHDRRLGCAHPIDLITRPLRL